MAKLDLSENVIKKIMIVKLFYEWGNNMFSFTEIPEKIGMGIILLQDAVEIFLIAICDHFQINIKDNIRFHEYFIEIEKHVKEEMPLKSKMLLLNRQRNDFKHHALLPNYENCKHIPDEINMVFDEICTRYLKIGFDSINLIDILNDGEIKEILKQAQSNLDENKYRECQIECSKAFYLLFESAYDIKPFEVDREIPAIGLALFSKAPFFATNKKYIDKYVKEPSDYIVIDHQEINNALMREGLSITDWENIRRLTPRAYHHSPKNEWLIAEDFRRNLYNRNNAEYCLRKIIEMILIKQRSSENIKYTERSGPTLIYTKNKRIKVFEKADIGSDIIYEYEEGGQMFHGDKQLQGFDGNTYFMITEFIEQVSDELPVSGYISADDVDHIEETKKN